MAKAEAPRGATLTPRKRPVRTWSLHIPKAVPVCLAVAFLMLGLGVLVRDHADYWSITQVDVAGEFSALTPETIAKALLVYKGTSYFELDVRRVRKNILQLPLVARVAVKKRWPDTLEVVVLEKVPVAYWNDNEVLASDGSVSVRPDGFLRKGLPYLRGRISEHDTLVRSYRRVQQVLAANGIAVDKMIMNDVQSLEARLSNGWAVRFGRQYFEERLQRLSRLIPNLGTGDVQYIDLRYGKGAAIRWQETGEAPDGA